MEILKQGDIERIKETKKFECTRCGCVWKADNDEFQIYERPGFVEYYMKCPCCNRIAGCKE